jgi:hypothetical protein
MIRKPFAAALLILSSLLLTSCSGPQSGGCTANCNTGNATVSLVLTATPPAPTSQLSIQAYTATITGITLTPTTGVAVNVALTSGTYIAEFNRVTSDSTVLAAAASVPVGDYMQMTVTFSSPRVTFCTQPNPGVPGCADNTLTTVSGAAGSTSAPINLSLAANQHAGLALNANLGTTLTATGQTITAVNLGTANTFSVNTLPPAGTQTDLAAGQFSHVDDVMGLVTNVTSSSVTVQTSSRGSITATANSSTQFDCSSQSIACAQTNTAAIIDTILNSDGTFTLTFYEPLPFTSADIIEGVVTGVPNSVTNQFTIAVTDSVFAASGSILKGQVHLGDQILVSLTSPDPFQIVSKGLFIPSGGLFVNSTSASSILPGQTVAFPTLSFTAQASGSLGSASAKDLALRFTRLSGQVTSAAMPVFSGDGTTLPIYFGLTTLQQFQTTPGRLSVDGVSNLAALPVGNTFSTTALYLGIPVSPQFASQTVRAH